MSQTIKKILIANRGEIALRIIRTCKKMGITSVAIYSEADQDALFVKSADESVAIGGNTSSESYLDIQKIITAAKNAHADAIHPGYGFLSENSAFAQAVIDHNLIFIGPAPLTIKQMGDKARAKDIAGNTGVPVIRGYHGADQSTETLVSEALKIGLPCMIKAAAGGGGKGLKRVHEACELKNAIASAQREGQSAFGDATLIIEKYIASPRHIEIQVFGDQHGNIIHLFERECTLQRRHQKVIEESPSAFVTEDLRCQMGAAAIRVAQAVNYIGAGTVEFVVDPNKNFYFLEMNTRLQVEHPVTEEITGLDLVKMQIETAMGVPLGITQDAVKINGHAMEARVYAEAPRNNFLPVTGEVLYMDLPCLEGIRYDMGIENGSAISVYYDPMLGKITAHAKNRDQCIQLLATALDQTTLLGTTTNLWFLNRLITHPEHIKGRISTDFIDQHLSTLLTEDAKFNIQHTILAAAVLTFLKNRLHTTKGLYFNKGLAGFRINDCQMIPLALYYGDTEVGLFYRVMDPAKGIFEFKLDGDSFNIAPLHITDHTICLMINAERFEFIYAQKGHRLHFKTAGGEVVFTPATEHQNRSTKNIAGALTAPLPGKVLKVVVGEGTTVVLGDTLMIVEAMKMEHPIKANKDGRVTAIHFKEGDTVGLGAVLMTLE
ncbi:MAG: ATP-grasp domain-containing protein [Deltaproteobacteria bacterium]|nr:ATP-grasp domain-containing protein [Deltaproteobacteria bacterium]